MAMVDRVQGRPTEPPDVPPGQFLDALGGIEFPDAVSRLGGSRNS